jgi:mono/diheme cytochrome c family protein
MKRVFIAFIAAASILIAWPAGHAHDFITTKITWNREISRIVHERCVSCHREGGRAFSMMTYAEARPWAVAIKEEVLARRMPPWGAVKGFGEFRNDQSLTQEQLELITSWVDGGVPEGDPKDAAPAKPQTTGEDSAKKPGEIRVGGDFVLIRPFVLDGLWPESASEKESVRIVAELPDGSIEPLLWLYEYKKVFSHPFMLKTPLELPARTVIKGIPAGAQLILIPKSD